MGNTENTYALTQTFSILDIVKWIILSVKQIKAKTVTEYLVNAGFGENNTLSLDKANENKATISTLKQQKNLPSNPKDYIHSDDLLSTHYNFKSAMELLRTCNNVKKEGNSEETEKEATQT